MTDVITLEQHGSICVVHIDNPPVNAASHQVRDGIFRAVETTDLDERTKAVILICRGKTFIAGADIKEFGKPPQSPVLYEVVLKLLSAQKPWIAAIHGNALGGGLELALGCRFRLAASNARLGLPEVALGLIPGAGGTVLLPRLIPMAQAIDMITGGKPMAASKAMEIGLVSALSEGDLLDDALILAQTIQDQDISPPISEHDVIKPISTEAAEQQLAKITAKSRGQLSPVVAFNTICDVAKMSAPEGFAHTRKNFDELRNGDQSKALRHIFFAERATAKIDQLKEATPRALHDIGVIGGGTMGAGIAAACLLKGLNVTMIETSDEAREAGKTRVLNILQDSQSRGLISPERFTELSQNFQAVLDYDSLRSADLVIEAVFEDMAVKQDVFARLDRVTKPTAVLATNTSYLDINEIANSTGNPSRVMGLHFFSPAHIMKLLEIVKTDKLADDVLATGFALAKKLSKTPVLSGVCDGFIGNRIMSRYRREADYLVEDGALPQDVDAAMRDFGFPMGIYQMQDLAGLDIAWAMRKRQAATRDANERYVKIADRLCELKRYGRKTGAGWYNYQGDEPFIDDTVLKIIKEERQQKSITARPFSSEEIMDRIMGVMQREGERILHEGIARCADDIDVVMTSGYGFLGRVGAAGQCSRVKPSKPLIDRLIWNILIFGKIANGGRGGTAARWSSGDSNAPR